MLIDMMKECGKKRFGVWKFFHLVLKGAEDLMMVDENKEANEVW